MRKVFLVGISTILRFAGQFLFIKSLSHLSEASILTTLNLQSLSVLLAGFSSGGIQTYLSKYISLEKIKVAWKLGVKSSSVYYLYALVTVLPCYLVIVNFHGDLFPLLCIIFLALGVSFSNNWLGLLTGQKRYFSLITVFGVQFVIFLLFYKYGAHINELYFFIAYPAIVIISTLISYFLDRSNIIPSRPSIISSSEIERELKSHRLMGIVLMTAGVAYPFISRNLLVPTLPTEMIINWDYLMRISTAFTSVSSFFIFTLFASDLSQENKIRKPFIFCSIFMLLGYLTVFIFFNQVLIKTLLSRDIAILDRQLTSFIIFEITKSFFSTFCIYLIITGNNLKYISIELMNLFFSSLFIIILKPNKFEETFYILVLALVLSIISTLTLRTNRNK